jgi:hypothetical protein
MKIRPSSLRVATYPALRRKPPPLLRRSVPPLVVNSQTDHYRGPVSPALSLTCPMRVMSPAEAGKPKLYKDATSPPNAASPPPAPPKRSSQPSQLHHEGRSGGLTRGIPLRHAWIDGDKDGIQWWRVWPESKRRAPGPIRHEAQPRLRCRRRGSYQRRRGLCRS